MVVGFLILYKIYKKINSENKVLEIAKENTEVYKKNVSLESIIDTTNNIMRDIYSKYETDSNTIKKLEVNSNEKNKILDIEQTGFFGSEIIAGHIDTMSHILSNDNNVVRISVWKQRIEDKKNLIEELRQSSTIEIFRSKNYTKTSYEKKLNVNRSISGRVLRKNEVQYISDITCDPDWENTEKFDYQSILGIPITNDLVIMYDFKNEPIELIKNLCAISALITSYLIAELEQRLEVLRSIENSQKNKDFEPINMFDLMDDENSIEFSWDEEDELPF